MEPTYVRPTDPTEGPLTFDQPWNWQGMGNNMAQEVPVTVR